MLGSARFLLGIGQKFHARKKVTVEPVDDHHRRRADSMAVVGAAEQGHHRLASLSADTEDRQLDFRTVLGLQPVP
jgi:hypothetical protein